MPNIAKVGMVEDYIKFVNKDQLLGDCIDDLYVQINKVLLI